MDVEPNGESREWRGGRELSLRIFFIAEPEGRWVGCTRYSQQIPARIRLYSAGTVLASVRTLAKRNVAILRSDYCQSLAGAYITPPCRRTPAIWSPRLWIRGLEPRPRMLESNRARCTAPDIPTLCRTYAQWLMPVPRHKRVPRVAFQTAKLEGPRPVRLRLRGTSCMKAAALSEPVITSELSSFPFLIVRYIHSTPE